MRRLGLVALLVPVALANAGCASINLNSQDCNAEAAADAQRRIDRFFAENFAKIPNS